MRLFFAGHCPSEKVGVSLTAQIMRGCYWAPQTSMIIHVCLKIVAQCCQLQLSMSIAVLVHMALQETRGSPRAAVMQLPPIDS